MSRRGVLALVGGGALLVAVLTAGQTIGGPFRSWALLLPRGRSYGEGPNDFQINKTAVAALIRPTDIAPTWRLTLHTTTGKDVVVSRSDLLAIPQHSATLPIACVEGWSSTQTWTGVRLAELAALAGVSHPASAHVESMQRGGSFSQAFLQSNQIGHPDALLALKVNGVDLSVDHGYPARIIVPAVPGVHCTKWVSSLSRFWRPTDMSFSSHSTPRQLTGPACCISW